MNFLARGRLWHTKGDWKVIGIERNLNWIVKRPTLTKS